eukprot:PLAT15852.1.p2 GENE.PLAT15852.1~~PLAT15852.1.p2  ORF type:complete len:1215 (+),score=618.85 PLAT15852.1:55-3699(+)
MARSVGLLAACLLLLCGMAGAVRLRAGRTAVSSQQTLAAGVGRAAALEEALARHAPVEELDMLMTELQAAVQRAQRDANGEFAKVYPPCKEEEELAAEAAQAQADILARWHAAIDGKNVDIGRLKAEVARLEGDVAAARKRIFATRLEQERIQRQWKHTVEAELLVEIADFTDTLDAVRDVRAQLAGVLGVPPAQAAATAALLQLGSSGDGSAPLPKPAETAFQLLDSFDAGLRASRNHTEKERAAEGVRVQGELAALQREVDRELDGIDELMELIRERRLSIRMILLARSSDEAAAAKQTAILAPLNEELRAVRSRCGELKHAHDTATEEREQEFNTLSAVREVVKDRLSSALDGSADLASRVSPLSSVFRWRLGEWSECSAACGGGKQRRAVSCVNYRGDDAEQALCVAQAGDRPADELPCNVADCVWMRAAWSPCSVACGPAGVQRRTRSCESSDGTAFKQLPGGPACPGAGAPPPVEQACYGQRCRWQMTQWGNCSAPCGGGSTERAVYCVYTSNSSRYDAPQTELMPATSRASMAGVAEPECPGAAEKPPASLPCNVDACVPVVRRVEPRMINPGDVVDVYGRYLAAAGEATHVVVAGAAPVMGNVTVVDEGHIQFRVPLDSGYGGQHVVRLQRDGVWDERTQQSSPREGEGEGEDEGEAGKPAAADSPSAASIDYPCTIGDESEAAARRIADDSDLPHDCRPTLAEVSPPNFRPGETVDLFGRDFGLRKSRIQVRIGEWTSQQVTYINHGHLSFVAPQAAAGRHDVVIIVDGVASRRGSLSALSDVPQWRTSTWSNCSATCGDGLQRREVWCQHLREGESGCPRAGPRPLSQRDCTALPCAWRTGPWSKCSKPCGGGVHSRQLWCAQADGSRWTEGDGCPSAGLPPGTELTCNEQACPVAGQSCATSVAVGKDSIVAIDSSSNHPVLFGRAAGRDLGLPPHLPPVRAVAAGWDSGELGLLQGNGSLSIFSSPDWPDMMNVTKPPANEHGWRALTIGHQAACAISATGKLACWGSSWRGKLDIPDDVPAWRSVSLYAGGGCGITTDGGLRCWGSGGSMPTVVDGSFRSVDCAVMAGHCLALTHDGKLKVVVGDGMPEEQRAALATWPRNATMQWRSVATTTAQSCALSSDWRLHCWPLPAPQSTKETTWMHVWMSPTFSCGVVRDSPTRRSGSLTCWKGAANTASQLLVAGCGHETAWDRLKADIPLVP